MIGFPCSGTAASGPAGADLPGTWIQSIHAFRVEGTDQLYIGAPSSTTSAASSSPISSS